MVDDKELERLGRMKIPEPGAEARARALHAAMLAFDDENNSTASQGSAEGRRLTHQIRKLWRDTMQKKLLTAPALAGLVALPIAGYATFYLMEESPFRFQAGQDAADQPVRQKRDRLPAEGGDDEDAMCSPNSWHLPPRRSRNQLARGTFLPSHVGTLLRFPLPVGATRTPYRQRRKC